MKRLVVWQDDQEGVRRQEQLTQQEEEALAIALEMYDVGHIITSGWDKERPGKE